MHQLRLFWAAQNEAVWLRRHRKNVCRRNLEKISDMPEVLFIERFPLNKVTFKMLCRDLRFHTSLRGTRANPLDINFLPKLIHLMFSVNRYLNIINLFIRTPTTYLQIQVKIIFTQKKKHTISLNYIVITMQIWHLMVNTIYTID